MKKPDTRRFDETETRSDRIDRTDQIDLIPDGSVGAGGPVSGPESAGPELFSLYGADLDLRTVSPLSLAFLGDAVYSLIIRTSVLEKGNRQAQKLHNETTRLVRAQKQAAIGRSIYDLLTSEEKKVYRRGRNSHPMHHAKGASLEEYLQATALETLCGYLYLQGRTQRLMDLLRTGLQMTQRRDGEPLL